MNNAGATYRSPAALRLAEKDWTVDLSLNLLAAVRLDRALLPTMIAGSGVIIQVGSGAAKLPQSDPLAYAAAKAALTTYSKGLADEVSAKGIRVNTVVPGFIETAAVAAYLQTQADHNHTDTAAVRQHVIDSIGIPMGRPGTPTKSPTSYSSSHHRLPASSPEVSTSLTAAPSPCSDGPLRHWRGPTKGDPPRGTHGSRTTSVASPAEFGRGHSAARCA